MTLGGDPFGAKDESLRPAVAPEVDLESASFDPKKYLATVHAVGFVLLCIQTAPLSAVV